MDAIISILCDQIDRKKKDCNLSASGPTPHGYVASLVLAHQNVAPWVTRDKINNMYRRRAKKGIYYCELGVYVTVTGAEDVTPAAVSLT